MDMNFGFNDLNDVNAHTGSRIVPDSGDYNVMISDIALESSKSGSGHNIHVKYSILDGDFAGSEIHEYLAVVNNNETAVNIARSKLKALYLVSGKTSSTNFTDLQGSVIRIRVFKKEATYTGNDGIQRNTFNTEVAMYMDSQGRNSQGKEVPPYTGPAVVASKGGNKPANTNNSNNIQKQQAGSHSDYDDDIPF